MGSARHLLGPEPAGLFRYGAQGARGGEIPEAYIDPTQPLTVAPDEVEEAFVKANPGLTRAGIAVTCGSTRLSEVRVCMGKDLRFRDCAEIDRRACRRDKLIMPPVRGGSATLAR